MGHGRADRRGRSCCRTASLFDGRRDHHSGWLGGLSWSHRLLLLAFLGPLLSLYAAEFFTGSQVKHHAPEQYTALPEDFRRRYEPAESQLFAAAKDADARQRSRQQAAEDLLWTIEHFADRSEWTGRSTYKALLTIFDQQCEVRGETVVLKTRTGGNRIQNPSDPDATYDAHKGPGYQVQLAETSRPANEVQLITGALPQTACEADSGAMVPMLDQLAEADLLPEEMVADTPYCSDENVQAAAGRGVDLVGPIPGREPASDPEALTVDDFAVDERTGQVEACPSGQVPLVVERDAAAGMTRIEMPASACAGCPFRARCPIHTTRDGRYTLEFSDKEHRLAGRRREQETPVFAERYAPRAGIESTNSGLKNRLGMDRLRVRGRGSVFRVILHKVAGWNVLRASASKKLRAKVKAQVEQTLSGGETGANQPSCTPGCAALVGLGGGIPGWLGRSSSLGCLFGRLSQKSCPLTRGLLSVTSFVDSPAEFIADPDRLVVVGLVQHPLQHHVRVEDVSHPSSLIPSLADQGYR